MSVEIASIAANLARVEERIARAAERAGRDPREITLVAISKTFPAGAIRAAYAAGVRHFGENRVQEWETKQPQLAGLDAVWHLVGHLQSNKARRAAQLFNAIDSVDCVSLAEKLNSALADAGARRLAVLVEVRLAHEDTKTGVDEPGLRPLAEAVLRLPHLDLRGLMVIPPYFDDPEKARPFFRRLRELRDDLRRDLGASATASGKGLFPELSMGMSHDFEVAIEEGATQVRLGTAIFGARQLE